jgi:hypothetical protein
LLLTSLCLAWTAGAQAAENYDRVYQAVLNPINTRLSHDPAAGSATFKIKGDTMHVSLVAQGFKPGSMVLMHFHGFPGGAEEGLQPSFEVMDANSDGVVDVIEINRSVGMTMVPFHGNPTSLKIKSDTYPEANADGIVTYKAEIDLEKLVPAMKEKFDVEGLRLDERQVVLHGVSRGTDLPESAQSVPGVPARMTLPVAFGEIELIRGGTDATAIRY